MSLKIVSHALRQYHKAKHYVQIPTHKNIKEKRMRNYILHSYDFI